MPSATLASTRSYRASVRESSVSTSRRATPFLPSPAARAPTLPPPPCAAPVRQPAPSGRDSTGASPIGTGSPADAGRQDGDEGQDDGRREQHAPSAERRGHRGRAQVGGDVGREAAGDEGRGGQGRAQPGQHPRPGGPREGDVKG